jgi:CTP synthase
MIGSQFHPEFLSRPNQPHPLFMGLIEAAVHFRDDEAERPANGYNRQGIMASPSSSEQSS